MAERGSSRPGDSRSGARRRGRTVSATRRPGRGGAAGPARPARSRSGREAASAPRQRTRSSPPSVGPRRSAAAVVFSPLARQILALGIAVCAVGLSLAYPLRSYLTQQVAEAEAFAEQQDLERQVADLLAREEALRDPAYIAAEAKRRLQFVAPGETVYVVKLPGRDLAHRDAATPGAGPASASDGADDGRDENEHEDPDAQWYQNLWDTLTGDDG